MPHTTRLFLLILLRTPHTAGWLRGTSFVESGARVYGLPGLRYYHSLPHSTRLYTTDSFYARFGCTLHDLHTHAILRLPFCGFTFFGLLVAFCAFHVLAHAAYHVCLQALFYTYICDRLFLHHDIVPVCVLLHMGSPPHLRSIHTVYTWFWLVSSLRRCAFSWLLPRTVCYTFVHYQFLPDISLQFLSSPFLHLCLPTHGLVHRWWNNGCHVRFGVVACYRIPLIRLMVYAHAFVATHTARTVFRR